MVADAMTFPFPCGLCARPSSIVCGVNLQEVYSRSVGLVFVILLPKDAKGGSGSLVRSKYLKLWTCLKSYPTNSKEN